MTDTLTEGGLRDHRVDFAVEATVGSIENEGSYEPFSDVPTGFNWAPDAAISARRGLGNVDPYGHDRGPETHELTVDFLMQGTLEASSPVYDAMARDNDGLLANSYTIVDREKFHNGGTNDTGYRVYTVGQGCLPNSVAIPGETDTGGPAELSIPYTCEKCRSYQIDQPSTACASIFVDGAAATVVVQDDTEGSIEITHDGTGTTSGSFTAGTFIDAIFLKGSAATSTVNIYGGTAATAEAKLISIDGEDSYDNLEGDRGVPTSSGTHATAYQHGGSYQSLIGDTVQWAGSDLAFGIRSIELSVDNAVETVPRQGFKKQRVFAGERTIQVTSTVYGNNESHDKITAHLKNTTGSITWTMDSNTAVVDGVSLIDSGDRSFESGQGYMELDNTFEGTGLSVNGTAV